MADRRSLLRFAALAAVVGGLAIAAATAAGSAPATVWLCRPGQAGDPCAASLATTVVAANGNRTTQTAQPANNSKFDCFYIYPTVSTETSANSDLRIQPAEQATAEAQASRFSQVCRVWAPMYRQETLSALLAVSDTVPAEKVAYASLLSGWQDYLAHYNDGRPIVFIGHSQGAAMLIRLLAGQVDTNPKLRAQLVSAIILGGNVAVPTGRTTGGSFHNIPACTSSSQGGCVIAYSSFPGRPPADSLFGIPGQGVSIQSGQTASKGLQVLCVNPAALGGGTGALQPYFPSLGSVATPWVSYPNLYTAACKHSGNATWLQVNDVGARSDKRPRVTAADGPVWGYHAYDVNLAVGNLVADVGDEEAAYLHDHR
jgi:Protein of unknown function (DUF3089)